jgi:fido (protein-threonine AMPylation protein)
LAHAEAHPAFHAEIRLYGARMRFSRYDLSALQAVHRQLFADIYDWASELRSVDLAKGAATFARARHLRELPSRFSGSWRGTIGFVVSTRRGSPRWRVVCWPT